MSFPQGGQTSGSKQLWDYTANSVANRVTGISIGNGVSVSIISLTGKGIMGTGEIAFTLTSSSTSIAEISFIIDGVTLLQSVTTGTAGSEASFYPFFTGTETVGTSTATASQYMVSIKTPFKFKNSFAVSLRNCRTTGAANTITGSATFNLIYYT